MSTAPDRPTDAQLALFEETAKPSPIDQFALWFGEALAHKVPEPTAMTLATADASGRPSARIVLCKAFDAQGFVFYTNYLSRKGHEIAAQPWASLVFFWQPLERQVRIEGVIDQVSAEDSDATYKTRPIAARIGAWASSQSAPVTLDTLQRRTTEFAAKFGDSPPRPPHWGGYRLRPAYFEFWQGRRSRLHDRLTYQRDDQGAWKMGRLAP